MPKSEATSKILQLYVSVKAALSLRRANGNDFHFLKLLRKDFETPEYNDLNTKLARKADVRLHPFSHVTYMPLINMNPAEPDTMHTTMKFVKSQSEQAGQEYTVFTNDQQLFKIAT